MKSTVENKKIIVINSFIGDKKPKVRINVLLIHDRLWIATVNFVRIIIVVVVVFVVVIKKLF
jgi:hypothetical protein